MQLFKGMVMLIAVAVFILYSGIVLPTYAALLLLVMALIMDTVTTYRCLKLGGVEANPIVRFFFKRIGFFPTLVLWYGVWFMIITYRIAPAVPEVQTAIAFAYWTVPMNNARVLKKLRLKQKREAEAICES